MIPPDRWAETGIQPADPICHTIVRTADGCYHDIGRAFIERL